jgi:hypothetical protein
MAFFVLREGFDQINFGAVAFLNYFNAILNFENNYAKSILKFSKIETL